MTVARAGLVLVLASALVGPGRAPVARAGSTCFGAPVTIIGSEGGDAIRGTSGPDVIDGEGGDDVIDGAATAARDTTRPAAASRRRRSRSRVFGPRGL